MDRYFHSELATLRSQLMLMGNKAVDALRGAVRSLETSNIELAQAVIDGDDAIDALEIEIDHEAVRYLSLNAPVATDLRLITVAIRASQDLERVGDEAKNIAKRCRHMIREKGVISNLYRIPELADRSEEMIAEALRCFIERDADAARQILAKDERVDELNKANAKLLIEAAKADPESIRTFIDLIFVCKSLERIADHATNLAEEIVFMKTAEEARHSRR